MQSVSGPLGVDTGKRKINDFYPTPARCTRDILDRVKFEGQVWEPCCGDGAISQILLDYGYDVKSSDLFDYGYGETGIDFLKYMEPVDNIVTNPPYKITDKFLNHGLNLVRKKLVILHRLHILEGKTRRTKIYNRKHLEEIHVYTKRIDFATGGEGGMVCFARYVFNKEYQGQPTLYWI